MLVEVEHVYKDSKSIINGGGYMLNIQEFWWLSQMNWFPSAVDPQSVNYI